MLENCLVIEPSMTLVAVNIPTNAVMPIAMMSAVKIARKSWA